MAALPLQRTSKRLQISKANATVAVAIGVASFVVAFSLVASKALWSKRSYQNRVIAAKEKARDQLKANVKASQSLANTYQDFVNTPTNFLGGNPRGQGDRDGDNAKLVLDALPSAYDYPALATSLEKVISDQGIKMTGISGTDDELNNQNKASSNPQPVEMPFAVTVEGDLSSTKGIATIFERSIRPIVTKSYDLVATDHGLQATIEAKTYYQPGTAITITKKVIK